MNGLWAQSNWATGAPQVSKWLAMALLFLAVFFATLAIGGLIRVSAWSRLRLLRAATAAGNAAKLSVRDAEEQSPRATANRSIHAVALCLLLALGGCAGQLDGVRPVYGSAGNRQSGFAESALASARAEFAAGRHAQAARHYQSVVAADPRSVEALNGLAASYDRLGRYDVAERFYRQALTLDPGAPRTLNNLGYSYYLQGRFDLAVAFLAEAQQRGQGEAAVALNLAHAERALAAKQQPEFGAVQAPKSLVPNEPTESVATKSLVPNEPTESVATKSLVPNESTESVATKSLVPNEPTESVATTRLAEPSPFAVAAPATVARGDDASDRLPIMVANGTGRPGMAAVALNLDHAERAVATKQQSELGAVQAPKSLLPNEPTESVATTRLAEPSPFAVAAPATVARGDDASDRLPIVVANGTGRLGMAARIGAHLATHGIAVKRLTNARPYTTRLTTIFHHPDRRAEAERLRRALPAGIRLVETARRGAVMRLTLGADLLDFDASLLYATRGPTESLATTRLAKPSSFDVAAPATVARGDDASDRLPIMVANGTGRLGMAARIGAHLATHGIAVKRLTNARPYTTRLTTIFHHPDRRAEAERLRRALPAGIRLVESQAPGRGASGGAAIRIELGADLLGFDRRLRNAARGPTASVAATRLAEPLPFDAAAAATVARDAAASDRLPIMVANGTGRPGHGGAHRPAPGGPGTRPERTDERPALGAAPDDDFPYRRSTPARRDLALHPERLASKGFGAGGDSIGRDRRARARRKSECGHPHRARRRSVGLRFAFAEGNLVADCHHNPKGQPDAAASVVLTRGDAAAIGARLPIVVVNGTGRSGMAARIGQHLAAQGHVLSGVTNIRPDGLRQTTIFHTADQRLPAEILRCTLNVWRAKDAAPAGIRLVETDQPRRDASGGAAIRIELGSDLLDYDSRLLKATKWRTAVTIQTESPIRRMALVGGLIAVLALGGCMGTAGERPQAAAAPIAADPKVLDLAERAVQQNRLDDARRLLERVFAAEPTHARGRLIMGEIHLAGGASEQAAQQFEALVEHSELKALAWQGLGTARLRGGDHEGACQALRHAVAADANLWRAWNGLGYCHDTEGNWSAAEAGYTRAIALNPKAAWLYNNRGFSRMLQQRLDAAVADFGRALQIDPNLELAKLNLRLALARSGRYAQALVGTAGKDAGPAMNNVGYVAMLNGDLQTAETYLQRAMAADAGFNQVAWRNLGYLQGLRAANGPAAPVAAPAAMPADPAGKKP